MPATKRGCGVREPGGSYLETMTSNHGMPIEYFLVDPPVPTDPDLGIPNRGVLLVPRELADGSVVHDVYDRVGVASYPNVADFIEEVRRIGLSRRVPTNIDWSLLSEQSRIVLCHPRAIIGNAHHAYMSLINEHLTYQFRHQWQCVCGRPEHETMLELADANETCASLWYESITGGEPSFNVDHYPRTVERIVGDIRYLARSWPAEGVTPTYVDGFFLRLPIHRVAIIRDPEQHRDVPAVVRASASSLPVVMEDA
jgi:hypothetical protein